MTALYHREANEPHLFEVLKQHEDGTVDLGRAGEPAIVTNCPIASEAKFGCCTLQPEAAVSAAPSKAASVPPAEEEKAPDPAAEAVAGRAPKNRK